MKADHRMTIGDARQIGEQKLRIDRGLFDKCLEQAKAMNVLPRDQGAMTLALALLGTSKAHQSDQGLQAELTDALEVVGRAEKEWIMEQKTRGLIQ